MRVRVVCVDAPADRLEGGLPTHTHTRAHAVIQRLMGCLAFTESGLERSPYASFFTGTAHWHSLETVRLHASPQRVYLPIPCMHLDHPIHHRNPQIFVREYYGHLGLLADSPLATVYVQTNRYIPF